MHQLSRGSAIAKIVGRNTVLHSNQFDPIVNMWVYEEKLADGSFLSQVINTRHENPKYLPGIRLPDNVVAVTDLVEAVKDADMLMFVIPHQFLKKACSQLLGNVKQGAFGISLIKGLDVDAMGLHLISKYISDTLSLDVSVLMGANIANEVALDKFCESTLGCTDGAQGELWKLLFNTGTFRISCVTDVGGVELCGALKNIVALAAGFADGMQCGENTKAAIIRIGLLEMCSFCELSDKNTQKSTFFESCGVADLITTCYGGRNRKVAEELAKTGKSVEQLEEELLNGQKLQGPSACKEVWKWIKEHRREKEFPLFGTVHGICFEGAKVETLFDELSK